ncbi:MAG: hypothetical protein R3Y45_07510 [Bacillota bacterium]
MSKKIIAILLCLVLACSLVACSAETTYTFDGVSSGPTTATSVYNNNSTAVFVDGYAFYVNASMPYYSTNTFGETTVGTLNRLDLSTGEIVTIQPKLLADSYASGFYIYGDKIYYTSPSDTTDRDGNREYTYLDIMVCDLNGANPEKLYTFGTLLTVSFDVEDGVVYALYEDEYQIKSIDLSSSKTSSTVIASDYTSGVSSSEGVYIVKNNTWYDEIYLLSPTGTETLVVSGLVSSSEKCSITILGVKDSKLIYTLTDSVVKQNAVTYISDLDGSNAQRVTALTVSSGAIEYNGGFVFKSDTTIFYVKDGVFTVLDENGDDNFQVHDGYLFTYTFTDGAAPLYKTDIDAKIADSDTERVLMFEEADDYMYESTIASLVFYDGMGYYFSDNAYNKQMYTFDVDGLTSYSIEG